MLKCEKMCILEPVIQCVEGKGKVRKLLFTELEEVLHTCIIWAENKQDVFQEPRRKSGSRSKEKNIVCLK